MRITRVATHALGRGLHHNHPHTLLLRCPKNQTPQIVGVLCMHHMAPNRHAYPSGDSHSWPIARGYESNRTTKLCLATCLAPLSVLVFAAQC